MKKVLRSIAIVSLLAALLIPATAFAAGAKAITKLPCTITASGSYCLTRNLTYTADQVDAITITASDVTLDLGGYGITGVGMGTALYNGINITGNGAEVRNGYITGFHDGVYVSGNCSKSLDLKLHDNSFGIFIAPTGYGAEVGGCKASNNGVTGIDVYGPGSMITNNVVYHNGTVSIADGIYVNGRSCVIGNSSYSNSANGITGVTGCTVKNNSSCNNTSYGIYTSGAVLVDGNAATGNNSGGANYNVVGATMGFNSGTP